MRIDYNEMRRHLPTGWNKTIADALEIPPSTVSEAIKDNNNKHWESVMKEALALVKKAKKDKQKKEIQFAKEFQQIISEDLNEGETA